MGKDSNKLIHFWRELKRRRVIHVITVYASAAFVIIELAGNLAEPLNLPASLTTIVIIVLAVGFLPAIILSWIYDLTSGKLQRTKSKEEIPDSEEIRVPNAWKVATIISFVVIIGLVALNIISRGNVLKPGMIHSLAILPFENFTGDEQLDYVAAGLHTSLIGDMGKLGALRVIGKTSSSIYLNSGKSASEISKELNVDALVEPAVMCYGDSICLQIKVITMHPEEQQLFVEEYKVDRSQVLNFFNQITKQIAEEMMVEITPEQERLLAKTRTVNREAFDEYLKAHFYWGDASRESLFKAVENLNSAIQREPDWAPLYSALAQVWMGIQQMGFEIPSIAAPEIFRNLNKALELDPELPDAHFLNAMIAHLVEWDWKKSEKEFLRALTVNPSDAPSRMLYAQLLCVLQRTSEAKTHGQLAYELDPHDPYMKIWYGALLPALGDCRTAVAISEEITADDPGNYIANANIFLLAYLCKDFDKVINAEKFLLPVFNIKDNEIKAIEMIYKEQGFVSAYERIMKHLEKFADNNPISFMDMAMRYIMADQPDKAMDWVERGFEAHDPQMTYIATKMYNLDPLFTHPRFIEIVEKMNLPLPPSD
jgi:TolB-like protein